MPDGTRWFWNYSPVTKTLLVHIAGSDQHYQITKDKMLSIDRTGEEMATYYRPFFKAQAYGMATHAEGGAPIVEWLPTRYVEIVKKHHSDRIPVMRNHALKNLRALLSHAPLANFPSIEFATLLPPVNNRMHGEMSHEQVLAYNAVVQQVKTTRGVTHPHEEHHFESYRYLLEKIFELDKVFRVIGHNEDELRKALEEQLNALIRRGEPEAAALLKQLLNPSVTWDQALRLTTTAVERLARARAERATRKDD